MKFIRPSVEIVKGNIQLEDNLDEFFLSTTFITVKYICPKTMMLELVSSPGGKCIVTDGVIIDNIEYVIPDFFEYSYSTYERFAMGSQDEDFSYLDSCEKEWVDNIISSENTFKYLVTHDWSTLQASCALSESRAIEIVQVRSLADWKAFLKRDFKFSGNLVKELKEKFERTIPLVFKEVVDDSK